MPTHEAPEDKTVSITDQRTVRETRLSLRTTARQDALIRQAASALDKSVTEFVLESASVTAEHVLADRRWFALDPAAWDAFEVALERPVIFKPRLSALMSEPDFFED